MPGVVSDTGIVVVDNDAGGSARDVAEAFGTRVRYVHEPVPGIAAGRARAVAETVGADALIFIDDDEEPRPGWLAALLGTWEAHGRPAGVVGRVSPTYAGDIDPWIQAGGFFVRKGHPTGTPVSAALLGQPAPGSPAARRARADLRRGPGDARRRGHAAHRDLDPDRASAHLVRRGRGHRPHPAGPDGPGLGVASRVQPRIRPQSGRARSGGPRRSGPRPGWRPEGWPGSSAGRRVAGVGTLTRHPRRQARGLRLVYRGAGLFSGALGRGRAEYARSPSVT